MEKTLWPLAVSLTFAPISIMDSNPIWWLLALICSYCLSLSTVNHMESLRGPVEETWANLKGLVREHVKRTHELASVVERFVDHERAVQLRVSADQAQSMDGIWETYGQSLKTLAYVSKLTSSFPDLKADRGVEQLIDDIRRIRNEIQGKLEEHNRTVRVHNVARKQFPRSIFATFYYSDYHHEFESPQ